MSPLPAFPMVPHPLPFSRVRALVLGQIRPSAGSVDGILRHWILAILSAVGISCCTVRRRSSGNCADTGLAPTLPLLSLPSPSTVRRPPFHHGRRFPRRQDPRVNTCSAMGSLKSRYCPSWKRREKLDSRTPVALAGQCIFPLVTSA